MRRILICRPDRLGDVILSTPVARELKKKYPDAFIAVMVKSATKGVYENNPNIDLIITDDYNDKTIFSSFWKMTSEIRALKFTDALMLIPNERLNYMLFLAGIKNRIGVGHKIYQYLTFTKFVDRKKYIEERHEADYCMDLARRLGVETSNLSTEIFLTESELTEAATVRKQIAEESEFLVAVHPSSGRSAPNMPVGEYRKLIETLSKYNKIKVIVTDPESLKDFERIPNVFYAEHNNDLRKLFVFIKAADILISASTGPMHAAAALKVNTLSVFCPLPACMPKLWGPLGNNPEFILPEPEYCMKHCTGDTHSCNLQGDRGITSETVLNALLKLIDNK